MYGIPPEMSSSLPKMCYNSTTVALIAFKLLFSERALNFASSLTFLARVRHFGLLRWNSNANAFSLHPEIIFADSTLFFHLNIHSLYVFWNFNHFPNIWFQYFWLWNPVKGWTITFDFHNWVFKLGQEMHTETMVYGWCVCVRVCMCVYVCLCVSASLCVCECVCLCACVCSFVSVGVCLFECVCMCVFLCTCACVFMCLTFCMYICESMVLCVCMLMYMCWRQSDEKRCKLLCKKRGINAAFADF